MSEPVITDTVPGGGDRPCVIENTRKSTGSDSAATAVFNLLRSKNMPLSLKALVARLKPQGYKYNSIARVLSDRPKFRQGERLPAKTAPAGLWGLSVWRDEKWPNPKKEKQTDYCRNHLCHNYSFGCEVLCKRCSLSGDVTTLIEERTGR